MRLIRLLRFWREDAASELDEELQFHLEERTAEALQRGLSPAEARAEAGRRLGDLARVRAEDARLKGQQARELRISRALEELRQDLGFALRQLRKQPGLAAGIVLALALGLGGSSALFGAVDALVLRPLRGVPQPGELAQVERRNVSAPALRDLTGQSRTLQLAGFSHRGFALEENRTAEGLVVSGSYFATLGVQPVQGRLLNDADDRPGAPLTAVVRWGFPKGPGESLRLNGRTVQVVGVLPGGFAGTRVQQPAEVFVTIEAWKTMLPTDMAGFDLGTRSWNWLTLLGRLRPGITLASAQAELSVLAERLHAANAGSTHYTSVELTPAAAAATGLGRDAVALFTGLLAGVVGLVLLLACANVANLLLARGAARSRELAVRRALGASRARILRQLLTESLVLALLGGALGFGLAALLGNALSGLRLPDGATLPELEIAGNPRALLFCLSLSTLSTLLFGLLPALQATRGQLVESLKEGASGGRARTRLRNALLVAQVALSMALLSGAGLLVRGLQHALELEVGFQPARIAWAAANPGLVHQSAAQASAEFRQVLAALPGAAWASALPLSEDQNTWSFEAEGRKADEDTEGLVVSEGYFKTMGMALISGRDFVPHEAGAPVAIVNQTMARRFFGGDALGKHVQLATLPRMEIVGVAPDVRYHALDETPLPLVYLPLEQNPRASTMVLLARSAGDARPLVPILRAAISAAAPEVPILGAGTLEEQLSDLLLPQRLGLTFLGAFALLGLLLASLGTASVVAFMLSQRTHELGVRLALGADAPRLLRMLVRQTLSRVLLGMALGLALAAAGSRLLTGLLYGLSPADPLGYGAAALALLGAGLLAAWLPARKVLRLDPVAALRAD